MAKSLRPAQRRMPRLGSRAQLEGGARRYYVEGATVEVTSRGSVGRSLVIKDGARAPARIDFACGWPPERFAFI